MKTQGLVDPQERQGGVRIANLLLATLVERTNTAYLCESRRKGIAKSNFAVVHSYSSSNLLSSL